MEHEPTTSINGAEVSEPITIAASDLEQNPHEVFRRYRPITPLLKREDGVYIVTRAADVERLTIGPLTRQAETEIALSRGVREGALFEFFKHTMLLSNGLDHRRRRAVVSRAFAFKLISELRPRMREIANEIIDGCYHRGEMNFIDEFAALVPARIISEILGLSARDIPGFTRCVYSLARGLSSSFSRDIVPELEWAAYELNLYVHDLLEDRRVKPRNDFLSSYIRAIDDSASLTTIEALMQIVTVILAGSDTTRAAMAIQTSLLLQHRVQWEAVCRAPALVPGAVLESLRYEPSVGSFSRVALEDIKVDDLTLPRNCVMSLSTLSAMRDPALYSNPDKFDITRTDHPRKHMVFGDGVHRCLGEVLARAELEEGLAAVVTRFPDLQFATEPPVVRGSGGIRTVTEMRVRWSC